MYAKFYTYKRTPECRKNYQLVRMLIEHKQNSCMHNKKIGKHASIYSFTNKEKYNK